MSNKTNEAALEALIERHLTGSCREAASAGNKHGEEHIASHRLEGAPDV